MYEMTANLSINGNLAFATDLGQGVKLHRAGLDRVIILTKASVLSLKLKADLNHRK